MNSTILRVVENVVRGVIHPIPEYDLIATVIYHLPVAKPNEIKRAIRATVKRRTVTVAEKASIVGPTYAAGAIPGFIDPVRVMFACMRETGTKPDGDRAYCHGNGTAFVERSVWASYKLIVTCPRCGRRLCQENRSIDTQFTDLDPALHDALMLLVAKHGALTPEEKERFGRLRAQIDGKVYTPAREPSPEVKARLLALFSHLES